ncbi:hypothetical protein [Paenibacillus caseinilyticus]|uniref:hypothetical protein n=1 Tax=Paenibacillus caseinilyticus TaxID=3098138 RepID=UPI0022B93A22|nr:hypothetical protein [Paenibacillus caseinilyticus]MCZ8521823.1 hypothetical protein [Paenibacillus caseinilyticus]
MKIAVFFVKKTEVYPIEVQKAVSLHNQRIKIQQTGMEIYKDENKYIVGTDQKNNIQKDTGHAFLAMYGRILRNGRTFRSQGVEPR